jgi:hypothetical protein
MARKIQSRVRFTFDSHWVHHFPAESNCHGGPWSTWWSRSGLLGTSSNSNFQSMGRNFGQLPNLPVAWDPWIPPPLNLHGCYSSPVRHPRRHRTLRSHQLLQSPGQHARQWMEPSNVRCMWSTVAVALGAAPNGVRQYTRRENGMEVCRGIIKTRVSFE